MSTPRINNTMTLNLSKAELVRIASAINHEVGNLRKACYDTDIDVHTRKAATP